MNNSTLSLVQTVLHGMSITLFGIVVLVIVAACIRPQLFRRIFQEFSERKYILAGAAFTALLSGTIFVVTQPMEKQTYVSENTKQTISSVDPLDTPDVPVQETIETRDVEVINAVAFSQQQRADPTLAVGQTRLAQVGQNGQEMTVYTVTYDKGAEISRVIKSKAITVQPTPEVTLVGSMEAPRPATTSQPEKSPSKAAQQQKNNSSLSEKICKDSRSWLCAQLR